MAAISSVAVQGRMWTFRNATAQANTGQTDWFGVPDWCKYMYIDFNVTAVAGTTPLIDFSIVVPNLTTLDDTTGVINLANYTQWTQGTAALRYLGVIGPGVTGIADDVTVAATGNSQFAINTVLPPFMGLKCLFDRTTGDETYTYSLVAVFQK